MQPHVMEVMSSIQGEGLLVGERQIFVRLAGCNLKCTYCDTSGSLDFAQACKAEIIPGSGEFRFLPNPVSIDTLVDLTRNFGFEFHHSVSFTGGEPLLFPDFLQEAIPRFKEHGLKIYLETNGTLAEELSKVGKLLDFISMDIKLPVTAGLRPLWQEHRAFLETAKRFDAVTYVKIVVAQTTPLEELTQACEIVRSVDKGIPLIIQPVTAPKGSTLSKPDPASLLNIHRVCRQLLDNVKVIPQTHKMLGLL